MPILNVRFLLGIAAATWCGITSAAWVSRTGEQLPESSYRKSKGDFVAQMVFVTDEQELFDTWSIPSNSVNVNDIDSVAINEPISTFIVFGGCKANAEGNCIVTMRFRVIGPDGKLYSETPFMEVWNEKKIPPVRSLQLSVDYLKIVVEAHELSGKYTVNAEVYDRNAESVIKLQRAFTAVKGAAKK
jgi:hypothetical protein